jgi:hypothetical protein
VKKPSRKVVSNVAKMLNGFTQRPSTSLLLLHL